MNIQINEKDIRVQFPYFDQEKINIVKAVPDSRRYNPGSKTWVIEKTEDNVKYLKQYNFIKSEDIIIGDIWKNVPEKINSFQQNGYALFSHQIKGYYLIESNKRIALFWEQGAGKTLPIISYLDILADKEKFKALIVCPKNVLISWNEQILKFTKHMESITIQGTSKKRKELLNKDNCIWLINYDLLTTMLKDLQNKNFDIIVFDESQYIKNPKSARSKAAYKLAKDIDRRYLLTGTPIGNHPEDIFQQFKVLDSTIFGSSFYCFRNRYLVDIGYGNFPLWKMNPKMEPELKRKIALRSWRLKKEDCLDLPEKLYQKIYIDMGKEQRETYQKVRNEWLAVYKQYGIDTRMELPKRMKMNQVASGFLKGADKIHDYKHKKIEALKEIWNDAGQPKIVIWTIFQHDIDMLMKEFTLVAKIDGRNRLEDTRSAIEGFQGGNIKVLICNEQAGGVGLTLTAANLVFIYSHSYSFLNRSQLEDRTHRIGQDKNVTYIDLITAGTIEEDIIKALEEKRKLSNNLLPGEFERSVLSKYKKGE